MANTTITITSNEIKLVEHYLQVKKEKETIQQRGGSIKQIHLDGQMKGIVTAYELYIGNSFNDLLERYKQGKENENVNVQEEPTQNQNQNQNPISTNTVKQMDIDIDIDIDKSVKLIKQELKEKIKGRLMIRKNNSYKGYEQKGIYTYNVYFDMPTTANKETLQEVIKKYGGAPSSVLVVGGNYGFLVTFRIQS